MAYSKTITPHVRAHFGVFMYSSYKLRKQRPFGPKTSLRAVIDEATMQIRREQYDLQALQKACRSFSKGFGGQDYPVKWLAKNWLKKAPKDKEWSPTKSRSNYALREYLYENMKPILLGFRDEVRKVNEDYQFWDKDELWPVAAEARLQLATGMWDGTRLAAAATAFAKKNKKSKFAPSVEWLLTHWDYAEHTREYVAAKKLAAKEREERRERRRRERAERLRLEKLAREREQEELRLREEEERRKRERLKSPKIKGGPYTVKEVVSKAPEESRVLPNNKAYKGIFDGAYGKGTRVVHQIYAGDVLAQSFTEMIAGPPPTRKGDYRSKNSQKARDMAVEVIRAVRRLLPRGPVNNRLTMKEDIFNRAPYPRLRYIEAFQCAGELQDQKTKWLKDPRPKVGIDFLLEAMTFAKGTAHVGGGVCATIANLSAAVATQIALPDTLIAEVTWRHDHLFALIAYKDSPWWVIDPWPMYSWAVPWDPKYCAWYDAGDKSLIAHRLGEIHFPLHDAWYGIRWEDEVAEKIMEVQSREIETVKGPDMTEVASPWGESCMRADCDHESTYATKEAEAHGPAETISGCSTPNEHLQAFAAGPLDYGEDANFVYTED